jgi:thiol:disulfide interchange protein/DsbC/DsbD-like thiol-disulfide interchange protein
MTNLRPILFLVLAWLVAAPLAPALAGNPGRKDSFKEAVPTREATVLPETVRRGQTVTLQLTFGLAPGWHTYPTRQTDPNAGDYVTGIKITPPEGVVVVGQMQEPKPLSKPEPDLQIKDLHYYEGKFSWRQELLVLPRATPGKKEIKASIRLTVCDAHSCLPPKNEALTASFTVSDAAPVPVDPKYKHQVGGAVSTTPASPQSSSKGDDQNVGGALEQGETRLPDPVGTPDRQGSAQGSGPAATPDRQSSARVSDPAATPDRLAQSRPPDDHKSGLQYVLAQLNPDSTTPTGLLSFLLAGIFWGGVSLVTPCVFPMIPITVSFFLKQSEKEHHRPLTMAVVYSLTIVIVLTFSAVVLLSFFRLLSISPKMNFALGALFVFFALSLFGMYDIQLPAGLARLTSAREGRGGLVGTMFMALTFTIVSFACVAPFLGGFGGTAAGSDFTFLERILGGLAFSATFAAPFFVLALFPSLLRKLPKSGSWLNTVKVVMGFLEMAAALKFFRAGELINAPTPTFFTYDLVLGMWIALAILAGLYLLNVYRLPHDTPAEHISVPGLVLGFLFLSLGFYLAPALFRYSPDGEKQRPAGAIYAWIDSFLLPESREGKSGGLEWSGDLKGAVAEARAYRERTGKRKLVFIDFTGETCTNCKLNERNVFSKPEISSLFQPYELVQLYTDKVPDKYYPPSVRGRFGNSTARQQEDAAANLWFQREAFGTEQLPLYVILEPLPDKKIKIAAKYAEGKINDENAFTRFLTEPLQTESSQVQLQSRP